jgi:5-formaminoimidazole-4-carboxamide-1-beta-D-ribofuranosyl 5'-monophosphate synthetase
MIAESFFIKQFFYSASGNELNISVIDWKFVSNASRKVLFASKNLLTLSYIPAY